MRQCSACARGGAGARHRWPPMQPALWPHAQAHSHCATHQESSRPLSYVESRPRRAGRRPEAGLCVHHWQHSRRGDESRPTPCRALRPRSRLAQSQAPARGEPSRRRVGSRQTTLTNYTAQVCAPVCATGAVASRRGARDVCANSSMQRLLPVLLWRATPPRTNGRRPPRETHSAARLSVSVVRQASRDYAACTNARPLTHHCAATAGELRPVCVVAVVVPVCFGGGLLNSSRPMSNTLLPRWPFGTHFHTQVRARHQQRIVKHNTIHLRSDDRYD